MPRRLVVSRLLLTGVLALVLFTSTAAADPSVRWAVGTLSLVVCVALLLVDTEGGRPPIRVRHEVSVAALAVLALGAVPVC